MLRKVLGSSVLLSAAPIAAKDKGALETPNLAIFRPHELPIYATAFDKDIKKYEFRVLRKTLQHYYSERSFF